MTRRYASCWLPVLVSVGTYAVFAGTFFPGPPGRLGHDYEYFLPLLLAGEYWLAGNGPLIAPRISPAFCAGLPALLPSRPTRRSSLPDTGGFLTRNPGGKKPPISPRWQVWQSFLQGWGAGFLAYPGRGFSCATVARVS